MATWLCSIRDGNRELHDVNMMFGNQILLQIINTQGKKERKIIGLFFNL